VSDEDDDIRALLAVDIPTADADFVSAVMLRVARRATVLRAVERLLAGSSILAAGALLARLPAGLANGVDEGALAIVGAGLSGCFAFVALWRQVDPG
jgi:NADH:ubiquinone oxidoreductase subunit 2 (subunit N)